jgi:hypothetical protein
MANYSHGLGYSTDPYNHRLEFTGTYLNLFYILCKGRLKILNGKLRGNMSLGSRPSYKTRSSFDRNLEKDTGSYFETLL